MLCDLLPFSPARLPGVEAVYDILLKDLEEKSWTESDDLDLRVISQLIGFICQNHIQLIRFQLLAILHSNMKFHICPLSTDKKKLAYNLSETVHGLFQVYNPDNNNCVR